MAGLKFTLKMKMESAYELANTLKSIDDVVLQTVGRSLHLMAENCENNDEESEFTMLVNKTGEFEDEDTTCPECGEEMEKIYKCFECGYSYDE